MQEILDNPLAELARSGPPRPPGGGSVLRATLEGRFCPDRVTIELQMVSGVVTACAGSARGCLLSEAATAAVHVALPGGSPDKLREAAAYLQALALGQAQAVPDGWEVLEAFVPLSRFPRRIGCVLLAFETAALAASHFES